MTRRIFRSIGAVALAVLLCSAAVLLAMTYHSINERLKSELEGESELAVHGVELMGLSYFEGLPEDAVRMSLIAADGTVLYDTLGETEGMANHLDRPEVQQALREGFGTAVRRSDTTGVRMVYCARLLSDGGVLRLSSPAVTFGDLLGEGIVPLLVLFAVTLLFGGIFAYRLSLRITDPINRMNLERVSEGAPYPELLPLVTRIRCQNQVITRQMEEMQRRRTELEAITDHMNEGLLVMDHRAELLSYNRAALRLLGVTDAAIGRSALSLCDSAAYRRAIRGALEGAHSEEIRSDGGRICRIIASPVRTDGETVGAAVLILDETEKEQREQLRREFTSNVSHELKTPLTSISGFAEIIRGGIAQGEDAVHFAGKIQSEAQRLLTLVNDIIKLTRLEEGGALIEEMEQTDLYALAGTVLERFRPVAQQHQVTLSLRGARAPVWGSPRVLDEMLHNLLDNAIKYNRPGGWARIEVVPLAAGVRVTVSDNGIGIPKDQQDRVFERFYRVDKSHSKEIGGTGLGLSIVKHGAALHKAEITMDSEPGRGTAVSLFFPTASLAGQAGA